MLKTIAISIVSLLLHVGWLQAQSTQALESWKQAQQELHKGNSKQALDLYQTAYELALKAKQPDFAASVCVDMATVYYLDDDYKKAIATCRRGVRLGNTSHPLTDSTQFKLFASLGEMFHQQSQPDSTNWYWQQARYLLDQHAALARQTPLHVAAYYGNRGTWAFEQGDFGLAEVCLRERIRLLSQAKSVRSQATAENQLATFYFRSGRIAEAEPLFRSSLQQYPTQDITKGWLLLSASDFYFRQQQLDMALSLLQQAAQIGDQLAQQNAEFNRYIWLGWGQYYVQRSQWHQAETALQKALHLGKVTNEAGTLPARACRLLSQLYAQRKEWDRAFTYAQAAIRAVGYGFDRELARPPLTDIVNGPTLVESLRWKADLWHQVATVRDDSVALERAIDTYQQTFWLTNQWQTSYQNEPSKLLFQQVIRPAYHAGLQAIYQQWKRSKQPAHLRLLLQVQEQSKAVILSEQQPGKLHRPVRSVKLVTEPSQWQAKLEPNTALLHYSLMNDGLLLTVQRPKQVTVVSLPIKPAQLKCLSDSLLKMMYYNPDPFLYEGYPIARQLYDQLIRPVLPSLKGVTRLVVIRDGALHQLPFEVFETATQPGSYLLRQYAISYAYSARALLEREPILPQQAPRVLSMAPFAPDVVSLPTLQRLGYEVLKASRSEVNTAGGTVSIGASASRQTFLELVGQHTQIHLATHAYASPNPANSYVAFYPETNPHRIYAYEISQLHLHHLRLAILSACRSGDGQVNDSEGLLSLARAFAQAGCPAVLTSLWEANDRSTSELTTLLYEQLRQGKPSDVALQQAKLAFIQQEGTHGGFAPPFYWAHLILMGQRTPTYPSPDLLGSGNWSIRVITLMGVVAIGLIGWWISKRVFASPSATVRASDPRSELGK